MAEYVQCTMYMSLFYTCVHGYVTAIYTKINRFQPLLSIVYYMDIWIKIYNAFTRQKDK